MEMTLTFQGTRAPDGWALGGGCKEGHWRAMDGSERGRAAQELGVRKRPLLKNSTSLGLHCCKWERLPPPNSSR